MILVDTDVLIEILDENSKKGEAALKKRGSKRRYYPYLIKLA